MKTPKDRVYHRIKGLLKQDPSPKTSLSILPATPFHTASIIMAHQHSSSDSSSDTRHSDGPDSSYRYSGSQSDCSGPDSDIHSDSDRDTDIHGSDHDSDMSVDTVIIPSQSSNSDRNENDGLQVEAVNRDIGGDLADGVVDLPGSRSVQYQGYSYSYYHGDDTKHYRCSAYRRTKCNVKLYVSQLGAVVQGTHKPNCVPEMRQVPSGPPPVFVNWKQQMLLATDQIGIRDVTLPPNDVWRMVRDQFLDDDNVIVEGATKNQVLGRLYRTRTKHFGRDIFGRLEMEPLCDVKNSAGLKFFQFHYAYYQDEVLHRIIGWAHPQLMDRIKQRHCSIFIDATYRCVPIRFYQLVILMLYDPISDLYLPIWYVLTTGKTSQVYEHLLHAIFVASKKKLDPAHVVCDFEYALIKAVKTQFPDSTIVGCLFHFKQALRLKMLKLKITEAEVNLAMLDGCIDRLTVIRRLDIVFRGIPDVRRMIKRSCGYQGIQYSKDNWTKFWKYFKTTWIKKFVPAWWNTNGLGEDIVNRTNNPLERYNRTLNDAFSVAHRDVTQFISVIEAQSREYVRLINDISNRRTTAPAHAPTQPAPAFDSDSDFEVDSDSDLDVSDPGFEASDGASVASKSPEY